MDTLVCVCERGDLPQWMRRRRFCDLCTRLKANPSSGSSARCANTRDLIIVAPQGPHGGRCMLRRKKNACVADTWQPHRYFAIQIPTICLWRKEKNKGSLQTIYRLALFLSSLGASLYAKAAALSSQTKLASSRANKCFSISEISNFSRTISFVVKKVFHAWLFLRNIIIHNLF